MRADCLSLPYKDNLFNSVICVGVLHHLVSARRQVMAIQEMCRILRPGGTLLLYVWAWEQPNKKVLLQSRDRKSVV